LGTALLKNQRIRSLTPIECERLQGFPDNWTKEGIDNDGNEVNISDTQRYKCLGNAVTVNVIEAIGKQLIKELEEDKCESRRCINQKSGGTMKKQ